MVWRTVNIRVFGNIGTPTRVCLSEALMRRGTTGRNPMTSFTLLGAAVILSTAIVTPVFAQAVIQEPGVSAFYSPNGDLRTGSGPSQRREREAVVGHGTADAMASAPPAPPLKRGSETTTRPWSAPVGHRQPRADEVPESTPLTQEALDQEDANVDRKIGNICRGC